MANTNTHTMEAMLKDWQNRLVAVERRLARTGTGGGGTTLTPAAGVLAPFAGGTAPTGWLVCDGTTASRALFPALFAAIGTTYGAGDGSTTFGLPNMKGRSIIGQDPAQAEFDTLGETGGAKTGTIDATNLPGVINMTATVAASGGTGDNAGLSITQGATAGRFIHAVNINNGVGAAPFPILSPYIVMQWIISTGTT